MTRPTPPPYLAETITDLLTIEAAARRQAPKPPLGIRIARFLEPRLMPYTVGSFASVIMFFLMFTALRPHFVALREAALHGSGNVLMVHTIEPGYDLHRAITPEDMARFRADLEKLRANNVSELSPTLDPGGALAALSRSYAHPHLHAGYYADADDMIVVTDVFSNGAASLAYVVQPPRDKQMLDDFESALRQTPAFVKSSLDRRPDTMRVVISLGPKVEVDAQKF
jgi:hypothetical protein